ncbi:hypothetical protein [Pseudoduganella armeniaca]|uniref:DUF2486 family protein n=1 Tax=Pseudoduganella armeniaca TaxID=2072590 RepID=A0A2R4CFE9_9BURK|nr:hypothetical protein [Pseudoduganella armeniaca]AVR98282.1 hypothetical protein C9I28_23550 [Pseudoduganella armeniaca]
MNQAAPFDASIPVLTEVVSTPVTLPVAQAPAPLPDTGSLGAAEWEQLERRLNEKILQQLTSRVDFVLEQRIKDSMAEVLTHALHDLTTEIRHGLHETIGKIVARAVQQEIVHLQAKKG